MTRPVRWAVAGALLIGTLLPAGAAASRPASRIELACAKVDRAWKPQSAPRRGRAIWSWETAFLESATQTNAVLRFARRQGAHTLFLYAPAWRLEQQPEVVRCFLAEAHRRKFTVHALQGEPNWIFPDQRAGAQEFVESLARFHQDQPAHVRFDALHFDVEPQSLGEWHDENIPRLAEHYLDFLRWSRARARELNLPLAIDVPPWYRDIAWGNGTLLDAAMEQADEIALMAYMDESWRIVNDSLPAVALAERSGKNVWVGLSADPLHLPRQARGRSLRKELERMRGRVEQAFPEKRSFRGVAIHDYVLYRRLFCKADCAPMGAAAGGQ